MRFWPLLLGGALLIAAGGGGYLWLELRREFAPPIPPLPPLLAGARGAGGQRANCADGLAALRDQPRSGDIARRLAEAAPPGSDGAALTRLLIGQGFQVDLRPCPQLPSVRLATFRQHRGGGLTYEGWAAIWWATDEQDRVTWTSGDIIYSGL